LSADDPVPKADHGLVAEPPRPKITFETVTFSGGQTLQFDDDEIIVFVGPNNAGKSAALRELQNWIKKSVPQKVVTGATLRKVGDGASLGAYLEKHAQKTGDFANISYVGMGFQIHNSHFSWFDNPADRHPVAPFFSVLIGRGAPYFFKSSGCYRATQRAAIAPYSPSAYR
jgi:hypothetical protein